MEQRQLRLHRILLLCGGMTYLGWWLFVRLALPDAFNPLPGRLAVVACFLLICAASYVSKAVADGLADWLAVCCGIATLHYFYLLERNHAELNWVVGSYITITAICAVLQTARSLLLYSIFVAALAVFVLLRVPELSFVVFMPGTLTILVFANFGLRSRLELLARLREGHQRIESLFDAGFEGVAVEDRGIIREVNGALSRLVGQPRHELVGKATDEILTTDTSNDTPADGDVEQPHEAQLIRRDGARVAVEVIRKRHMLHGKMMRLVAIRDVTARKQAEAALVLANHELESFSYSVAHDLRAPLRGIDGFSLALLEDYGDRLDPIGHEYLHNVRTSAQRMGELIDDLLKLSRVGRAELSRQQHDLSRLATDVVEQLRRNEPEREVTCTIQPGIVVDADGQLLRILLENLIGNAWKFTSKAAGATIELAAEMRAEGLVHTVRDNGAGFDMAYASKLFIPFQRLHGSSEYPGTGIGLATVQRIVHRHAGRVWAEATVDRGATFHFTLSPR